MPQIEEIVETLREISRDKRGFLNPVTVDAAANYLAGFLTGCFACGLEGAGISFVEAEKARGWTPSKDNFPIMEMRGRGLTEDAIIDELIEIYIQWIHLSTARNEVLR